MISTFFSHHHKRSVQCQKIWPQRRLNLEKRHHDFAIATLFSPVVWSSFWKNPVAIHIIMNLKWTTSAVPKYRENPEESHPCLHMVFGLMAKMPQKGEKIVYITVLLVIFSGLPSNFYKLFVLYMQSSMFCTFYAGFSQSSRQDKNRHRSQNNFHLF